ncbi:MAG TPA: hypothetical protein VMG34_06710 [Bacteroidota bacterium]|nr:hypothetical protein [Bacteroidota bacterium]
MKVLWFWLIFAVAAGLEVTGDAVIRKGLRSSGWLIVVAGVALLGLYGTLVNTVKWDFSKLLGVYIAVFAAVSTLFGRVVLHENIPSSTWTGVALIMLGGLIIQFGGK